MGLPRLVAYSISLQVLSPMYPPGLTRSAPMSTVTVANPRLRAHAESRPTQTRATAADVVEEEDTDPPTRWWTNHAGGYYVCSHQGCSKKVNPIIFGHDCGFA